MRPRQGGCDGIGGDGDGKKRGVGDDGESNDVALDSFGPGTHAVFNKIKFRLHGSSEQTKTF